MGVVRLTRRYALGDDGGPAVSPEVDHLGAGVGLLMIVRDGDGIELAHRFLARQHAARIFPGDGGAGLHLRPRHLRSEEHTSELQSLMRISYAVFCLKKNIQKT